MKIVSRLITALVVLSILLTFSIPVFAESNSLSNSSLNSVDFNNDKIIDILDLILMKKSISNNNSIGSDKIDGIKYNTDDNFVSQDVVSLINVILGKTNVFEKYENSEIEESF